MRIARPELLTCQTENTNTSPAPDRTWWWSWGLLRSSDSQLSLDYLAIKRNEILIHAPKGVNLENMTLRCKRLHVVGFHVYEMPRRDKSKESARRLPVPEARGGGLGADWEQVRGFLWGDRDILDLYGRLYSAVNVLDAAELHALKWPIFFYEHFTPNSKKNHNDGLLKCRMTGCFSTLSILILFGRKRGPDIGFFLTVSPGGSNGLRRLRLRGSKECVLGTGAWLWCSAHSRSDPISGS